MMVRSRLWALLLLFAAAPVSFAATFTVTSSADSGPGTLRQAILDANATAGRDRIEFSTDSTPTSALPAITDAVDIDGSIGTGRARILADAVVAPALLSFSAGSSTSTLRDLEIHFSVNAVRIEAGVSGVVVAGNRLVNGSVEILGDNNLIGGSTAADANHADGSVFITGGDGNQILGNDIGSAAVFNGTGNQIGSAAFGNRIRLSVSTNESPGTIIQGNTIGGTLGSAVTLTQASGVAPPRVEGNVIQNSIFGIFVQAPNTVIRNNTIQNHAITGVTVLNVTGVEITGNRIFETGMPIDLGGNLTTPNDPSPDADTGANDFQNYPVLESAELSSGALLVRGTLHSAPSTTYLIELFSNPPATAQSTTLIDSFPMTTDATGTATFQRSVASPLPAIGDAITATATNRAVVATPGNSPSSTSEVSAAVVVSAAAAATAIPTASTWGLIALALTLAAIALRR